MVDTHASAELIGLNVVTAVVGSAVGVLPGAIITGAHYGQANLVDLETGRLVWYNFMLSESPLADLRTPSGAQTAVEALLQALPI